MTWDVPVAENCSLCAQTLFKASGRGARKPFCINEKCKNFLPEDKRGYKRKPKDEAETVKEDKKPAKKKPAAKKSTTKRKKPTPKK